MKIPDLLTCIILSHASFLITGCKITGCTAISSCASGVSLEFNPPISANKITVTIFGDDASYTATYPPPPPPTLSSGKIGFVVQNNADAGGFSVSSISLASATLSTINYTVSVDDLGTPVAQGSVTPQYQRVTYGSDDCSQSCDEAKVIVNVTQ